MRVMEGTLPWYWDVLVSEGRDGRPLTRGSLIPLGGLQTLCDWRSATSLVSPWATLPCLCSDLRELWGGLGVDCRS